MFLHLTKQEEFYHTLTLWEKTGQKLEYRELYGRYS